MEVASGTYSGHVLPGVAFAIWGLWWLLQTAEARGAHPEGPLETTLLLPVIKILFVPIGIWFEMPHRGWVPMDAVMGLHHLTIYVAFGMSGAVDLLARRGLVDARATYWALAGAALVGALLFYGHGNGPGVEAVAHRLLAFMFLVLATFAVVEGRAPGRRGAEWFRIGAMLGLGIWLATIGWVLFGSGWSLTDPVREGWTYLLFAWVMMAVTVLVLATRLLSGRSRSDPVAAKG